MNLLSAPRQLAGQLARLAEGEALAFGELLDERQETLTVGLLDHGGGIRRFDGVGITRADDALGAHQVERGVGAARLHHPQRQLDARRRPVGGEPHVAEGDLLVEGRALLLGENVEPGALEERRAVAPGGQQPVQQRAVAERKMGRPRRHG